MKTNALFVSAVALTLLTFNSAYAAELISNGGFEDGVYTSTLDGDANPNVPVDWTPNAAFDLESSFNQIRTSAHSGSYNLSISNYDAQPVANLSQSLSTVAGDTYSASLYVLATSGGDPAANFTASVDGVSEVSLPDTINAYTEETFSFIGTGHDTLTLAANTNPGEWYVDDVSVTGAAPTTVSAAPEPSAWALMIAGVAMIGLAFRQARRRQGSGFANAV